MKLKKEKIRKIILGILTFVLILYISFGLVFLSLFNISKKILNKENIYNYISNIDISSILKDELGNELKEYTLIKDELSDIGITSDGINSFINSNDVKEFSVDAITSVFDKVYSKGNIDYKITNEQINNLLENNIDKLEINEDISETQILNRIEKKIPNIVLNINELLDRFCYKLQNSNTFLKYYNYIYKLVDVIEIVYSDFILYSIGFVIISLILLLIFIRNSIDKSLKWLSISFLIPSIIFGIISTFILSFINSHNIILNNVLKMINKDLIKHSIMYFIISFIFIIINIIIYIIKKYKKKKKVSYE